VLHLVVNPRKRCMLIMGIALGIELSDAETTALLNAPDFQRFIENSGKVMQRAMNDSYDYTKDYAMGFGDVE
jgi:hypothetical protein